ncbi:pantetheine-phosphate adenylyltransferase [Ruficoccus amylovorans]|uniref:Phosphopantetheine adenylyltransferase n=1 Tax=Ruficoccus amylovorans TaxID=1804625 RepID=A0A842HKE5_9BACT|nr:pantetheine-phosphate adenylyltransferase [Ruficoccus amylovorans]MBC2596418.1 pantetheine-phosphate adenylyltransferase [Ruficoccus amylovorans]
MRRALYAGTFDPVTNGHLDVLRRACELFDEVIMAAAPNREKHPLLPVEQRAQLIEENLAGIPNARVAILSGLTVDFARKMGAQTIVRGLRAISDFEFEFQLAQMNRDLAPEIETIFLMPKQEHFYTSSSLVKAVAQYDPARTRKFVPANALAALQEALGS